MITKSNSSPERVHMPIGRGLRHVRLLAALVTAGLAGTAAANSVFVIDDWTNTQYVNSVGVNGDPPDMYGVVSGAGILGGERDIHITRLAGGLGLSAGIAGIGTYGHSQDTGVRGITRVIWDGPDGDATVVDHTGLGGMDLSCGGTGTGTFSLRTRVEAGHTMRVRFDVWSDSGNWSYYEQNSVTTGGNIAMIAFDFGDFDLGGGTGADFTDVGAIQMTIEGNSLDADLTIFEALTNCGFDFGDAPDSRDIGAPNLHYYPTLSRPGSVPFSGGNEGGNHLIRGPWMPTPTSLANLINDTDAEADGQPTPGADGDDNDGYDDEESVVWPTGAYPHGHPSGTGPALECDGLVMPPATYCAAVRVANPSSADAALVAWLDFDGDGYFNNECPNDLGTVAKSAVGWPIFSGGCERAAAALQVGSSGLWQISNPASPCSPGSSFSTGNVPAGCFGTVVVTWNLSALTGPGDITTANTYARFRISTDDFFKNSGNPRPWGTASDGEIEDYLLAAGTVPVSVSGFESRQVAGGLEVKWSTVSESENLRFYIWGDRGNGMQLLTPTAIDSTVADLAQPQSYSVLIPSRSARSVQELAIVAEDVHGKQEVYGLFKAGSVYGRESVTSAIAWDEIRGEAERRADLIGPRGGTVIAADFRVQSAGMQRIRHADLLSAGLDLRGVPMDQIAVTLLGEGVPRHVHVLDTQASDSRLFDSSSVINFWGVKPSHPDSLYIDSYVYRVEVNPALVKGTTATSVSSRTSPQFHQRHLRVNEDVAYRPINPNDDPWYAARLRAGTATNSYSTQFQVDGALVQSGTARVQVQVGGETDWPRYMDHRVQLRVNGHTVTDQRFDGQTSYLVEAEFPASHLVVGNNTITVHLPGQPDVGVDIVLVDTVALNYPRRLSAEQGVVVIDEVESTGLLQVTGVRAGSSLAAYGWDGEKLYVLPMAGNNRASNNPTVSVGTPRGAGFSYWLSSQADLRSPQLVAAVPAAQADMLTEVADLLVIAHPAFLPVSPAEQHPLNTYVQQRRSEGWSVAVHNVEEIQLRYGGGMALPQALTRFLAAADQAFDYRHVLLVGGDSYDYADRLGLGSLSFIPTVYAGTSRIRHTPSDALLVDLNGDGTGDKSLGRWPVRSQSDLQAIVDKTLAWGQGAGAADSAVWVSDLSDPNQPSFEAQSDRMIDRLGANWQTDHIRLDEIEADDPIAVARGQLFDLLQQGRSLTGFSGHGAPTMWTNHGLLTPNDLGALDNRGSPTLIGTLTCYTSYFTSPYAETVAHRWMNGYLLGQNGQPIPGAGNGAVAIHGAATLSSYQQNEVFAAKVLEHQQAGATLGEAVLAARQWAGQQNIRDLVINWTLLGDPTLRIEQ